jgi:hypothetical protein
LNETLHRFPRRFSKRSIASVGFSHSLDPTRTWDVGQGEIGLRKFSLTG